ncbi:Sec-independent protein translocase protein TatB [Otariodibacter oris]|uniref:Sec-independent protein translocase protein TatB n=1 Tax=Otariodibacter oris TaxID=1032623 RepID=A0A420XFI8_9PAST|nr:Sec-independent protein translocase protein TatB [Otariodibacter oris]QGM81515.1 twin arginine-targeting protein translocase TatB [Otariodibacter oris]RKR71121.1 sec-independent protein translocase protein TatB [Otariodibacter oris]
MFDIGFSELLLILIIGLVVLGPKRLPIAIRTVMGWVATIRGLASNVQNELAQELKLQELQESIKKAEALNLTQLSPELTETVEELKQSAEKMKEGIDSAKKQAQSLAKETQEQINEIPPKPTEHKELGQKQVDEQSSLSNLQNKQLNSPLESAQESNVSPSGETAELAEADEDMLSMYYPLDDDLAVVDTQTKQDKSDVS